MLVDSTGQSITAYAHTTNNIPQVRKIKKGYSPQEIAAWYAICTKSRCEKKLFSQLKKAHFHAFLPLRKEKRQWSDRIKTVETPLLPSYVFVRTSPKEFRHIYPFPGFARFLSFQGKPAPIKEREIILLQNIITFKKAINQQVNYRVGDRVRINSGPFKGWEGRIDRQLGSHRVAFQLESLGQAICVEVEKDVVEVIN